MRRFHGHWSFHPQATNIYFTPFHSQLYLLRLRYTDPWWSNCPLSGRCEYLADANVPVLVPLASTGRLSAIHNYCWRKDPKSCIQSEEDGLLAECTSRELCVLDDT
jgi:hypothetical protein